MKNVLIAPSLLCGDPLNLEKEVEMVNGSDAGWLHVDIMDGVFVPNIAIGFPTLKALSKVSTKPLDVHLMIVNPEKWVDLLAGAGTTMMTVHYEVCPHLHRLVQQIHQAGMKAGVALNPATPVGVLEDIICDVDMVLLMSVNPGFGGQKFIENTYAKCERLRRLIADSGSHALIEVDGGVNGETGPQLASHGADILVSGSYVFKSANPQETIASLKKSCEEKTI